LQALGLTIGRIKFAVGTIQQDVGVHAAWLPRAHFRKIRKTFFTCVQCGLGNRAGESAANFAGPSCRQIASRGAAARGDGSDASFETLLIAGAYDTWSFAEDREGLLRDLVHAPAKRSVLIPDATHFVLFEKNRLQFFEEVLNFVKQ
jgi:pimeloyl-ACP methyl ester carboxylesterase